jgi:hypothetical protein
VPRSWAIIYYPERIPSEKTDLLFKTIKEHYGQVPMVGIPIGKEIPPLNHHTGASMPHIFGDIDLWNLPSRRAAASAFRKYGLRVLLLLLVFRLVSILYVRIFA